MSSLKSKPDGFDGFAPVPVPQGFSVHTAQLKITSTQLSPVAPCCTVQSWIANPWYLVTHFQPALLCMSKSQHLYSACFNAKRASKNEAAVCFSTRIIMKSVSLGN